MSDFLDYVDWFTDRTKQWGRFLEMLAGQTEMAIMLIEAPTLMGKTFLIKRMAHHCDEERFAHAYIDFAGPQVTSHLWLARQVREQLAPQVGEKFFARLNQKINHYTDPRHAGKASGPRQTVHHLELDLDDSAAPRLVQLDLGAFRAGLIDSFSHAEMRDLAFALELHHDDIEGETRSAYALGLITRCESDGLLPRLLNVVKAERPDRSWWDELSAEEQAAWRAQQEADEPAAADSAVTPDLGFETLPADEVVLREAKAEIDRALLDCLSDVCQDHRITFLFDSYERGDEEVEAWLSDNMLMPIVNKKLTNCLLVIAGQQVPDVGDRKPIVGKTGLALFTEEHVREYIEEKRKIEPQIDFYQASQGNPYILATVVSNMTIPTAADDSW